VLAEDIQGLKLHPLMIVKGSRLAVEYRRGEVEPPALAAYVETAAEMIRRTPAEVVYHRVAASAYAPTLIAPDWCSASLTAANAIAHNLAKGGAQGCLTARPYAPSEPPCSTPARNSAPGPGC
jgi:radical SAM superfamily enzyme